jgi:hypothetical protein
VVREVAAILRGEPVRAEAVRAQLRSAVAEKHPGMSVLDIFGSDLPDHYFDGVFDQDRRSGKARTVDL